MKLLVVVAHFFILRIVNIINIIEYIFAYNEYLYKLFLVPGFETFRWGIGSWRAWNAFNVAYRKVPAYRDFISKNGGKPVIMLKNNIMPDFGKIPEMDKQNYIKKYSNEERVKGGRLPKRGVMVDESSGSSGTPTSWVRGPRERSVTKQMLQLSYHTTIKGSQQTFVINGFALGAWATGLNVTMSLIDITIIKSTGPNIDKIISTLQEFGADYHYIITGYPPFLKTLVDDERIDLGKYNADAVFGGEGISEGLRDYLLTAFNRVTGSYGASDLEINMAAETPLTIGLRKKIIEDEELRKILTHPEYGNMPMIFQYNPLAYMFETNDKGELLATLCRSSNISPRIRYNIHDRGHVMRFAILKKKMKSISKWEEFAGQFNSNLDLPVLFLYGRSDMSIDYYGANVTPESVRDILYGVPELAKAFSTFRLISTEDKHNNKHFAVAVELKHGVDPEPFNNKKSGESFFEKLAEVNKDFSNAYLHTATEDNMPEIKFYKFETGPFEGGQHKLKNEYVKTDLKYDKL